MSRTHVPDTTVIPIPEKRIPWKKLITGIVIACIIGGALYTYFAVIRPASTGIPQPPAVQPPIPTPAPPVVTTPTPTPTPTPPQRIEVKWESGGPYGDFDYSGGFASLYIYSADGLKVRALDGLGNPWITENGGKSWKQGWGGFSITQQEKDALADPNHYEGFSTPKWKGWKTLLSSFPSDKELHKPEFTKTIFEASDPHNNQNLLVSVVMDDVFSSPEIHYSRLFLSRDGGKTWRELSTPSPSERGLRIGAVAIITTGVDLRIYIGLAQWQWNSCVWQTAVSLKSLP